MFLCIFDVNGAKAKSKDDGYLRCWKTIFLYYLLCVERRLFTCGLVLHVNAHTRHPRLLTAFVYVSIHRVKKQDHIYFLLKCSLVVNLFLFTSLSPCFYELFISATGGLQWENALIHNDLLYVRNGLTVINYLIQQHLWRMSIFLIHSVKKYCIKEVWSVHC